VSAKCNYVCGTLWEPLRLSESCRTRIPGWSNPRVTWTDTEVFRCTWEHLGAPITGLGASGSAGDKLRGAGHKPWSASHKCWSTGHKPWSAGNMPGCANEQPESPSNHSRAVWEKQHLLSERYWYARKSQLLLIGE